MIASMRGQVLHVGLDHVVIDVGGVGMRVHVTPGVAASAHTGTEAMLWTTLVVREESLTLYGFDSHAARSLFEQVQTVSGVGPRLALAMLSVHTPEQIHRAISGGDIAALTKVPGIGRKSAERLVLELRDKIMLSSEGGIDTAAATAPVTDSAARGQVREALLGLGWNSKQAEAALDTVTAGPDAPEQVADLLRLALRELGR